MSAHVAGAPSPAGPGAGPAGSAGSAGGSAGGSAAEAGLVEARGARPWRSFAVGARLGWTVAANWTDPFLFAVYSVARPVAASLVLVAIVWLVGGGKATDYIGYLVVGSACWTFVGAGMSGFVWAVLDDRERYRMLKYVVVSPVHLLPFLVGRAATQLVAGATGFLVTLLVGVLLLGARVSILAVNWPLLLVSMAFGLAAVVSLGLAIAGLCLTVRRESWSYPEAIGGALYLLSGAIFPPDVLPEILRPVTLLLPTTWWLEGARRALLGQPTTGLLGGFSDLVVALALIVSTGVLAAIALAWFSAFERRARERGLIDQSTGS